MVFRPARSDGSETRSETAIHTARKRSVNCKAPVTSKCHGCFLVSASPRHRLICTFFKVFSGINCTIFAAFRRLICTFFRFDIFQASLCRYRSGQKRLPLLHRYHLKSRLCHPNNEKSGRESHRRTTLHGFYISYTAVFTEE